MTKVGIERKVHFHYTPEFIAHWNEQSEEFKNYCNTLGAAHGYSGHNIFYTFYLLHHAHLEAGIDQKFYQKKT